MSQIIDLPLKIGQVLKIEDDFYIVSVSRSAGCLKCDYLKKCRMEAIKSFCPPWTKLKLLSRYESLFLNNKKIFNLPLKKNDVVKLKDKYYRLVVSRLRKDNCKNCCFRNSSLKFCSIYLISICGRDFMFEEVERNDIDEDY